MREEPMNYHHSSSLALGLRPRAPHSGIPLSSLASSSGGSGNILAATILDISTSSPSSHSIADSAQPQSKSEQDLAHYLATSNPSQSSQSSSHSGSHGAHSDSHAQAPLNREQTLLLAGEWGPSSSHSLGGGMFASADRSGGLMAMSMSWNAPSPGNPHPDYSNPDPSATSSGSPDVIQPYTPQGEYFHPPHEPAPVAGSVSALQSSESALWALTHAHSHPDLSLSECGEPHSQPQPYSDAEYKSHVHTVTQPSSSSSHSHSPAQYAHSPAQSYVVHSPATYTPSPPFAPLSLPLPASSPLLRVNVNTAPRLPIQPALSLSPHSAYSPALPIQEIQIDPRLHSVGGAHTHVQAMQLDDDPHADSSFGDLDLELGYPADAADGEVPQERYVTLEDLTAPPAPVPVQTHMGTKREYEHAYSVEQEGPETKRLCLRDPGGVKPESAASGHSEDERANEEQESTEESTEDGDGDGGESSEYDEDDDSGEFVLGRSVSRKGALRRGKAQRAPRPRRSIKKEQEQEAGEVSVSASEKKQRNRGGNAGGGGRRKKHVNTGVSAAEALRVVTELAAAAAGRGKEKAVASAPAPEEVASGLVGAGEGEASDGGEVGEAAEGSRTPVKTEYPSGLLAFSSPPAASGEGFPFPSTSGSLSTAPFDLMRYSYATSTPGAAGPYSASPYPHHAPSPANPHAASVYPPGSSASSSANANTTPAGLPAYPYPPNANAGMAYAAGSTPYASASTPFHERSMGAARKNTPIPLPVPVPNLIKKSRGRNVPRVPVASSSSISTPSTTAGLTRSGSGSSQRLVSASASGTSTVARTGSFGGHSVPQTQGEGQERGFVCTVDGCGKCFVRGEHLKRHVRSIHTYEKPYTCPHDGCGKSFSRRDNLAQHSRVHLP
ncbi:hypothetical protein K438DRAFT_2046526 [Mycena galopus ATCC 62051]|nr:hypothetical protein K438DRAFT_2046526 [Mycena galopus ATCC 62051]